MRRLGAALAVALLWHSGAAGQDSSPASRAAGVAKLIPLLDSDDFATRERATAELLALGELARPHLVLAREEGSLERRMRIGQILDAIGVRASSRPPRRDPTRVSLEAASRPVSEVAALLSARSGYEVRTAPGHDEPVTLDVEDVSFFEALDRLCAQAQWKSQWDAQRHSFVLEPGADLQEPVAYGGPLRVSLVMIANTRQVRFAGGTTGSGNVQIRVESEPRSQALGVTAPFAVKEAVDDQRRSFAPQGTTAGASYPLRFDQRRQLLAFVPIGPLEPDAKAIARFEFTVPLLLPTHFHEAEIPNPAEGATAGQGAFRVVVDEWAESGSQIRARLTVDRPQATAPVQRQIGLFDDTVTFVGPDGAAIRPISQQPAPSQTNLTWVALLPAQPVAAIRVSCLEQFEIVEIPFLFENVRLP